MESNQFFFTSISKEDDTQKDVTNKTTYNWLFSNNWQEKINCRIYENSEKQDKGYESNITFDREIEKGKGRTSRKIKKGETEKKIKK